MSNRGGGRDRWEEALHWHLILQEGDEEELTNRISVEWQYWYADAENQRIFDNLSRLLSERGLFRKRCAVRRAELAADRYDLSVPITEWRDTHAPHERSRERSRLARTPWRWLTWGIALAPLSVLAALMILGQLRIFLGSGPHGPVVYQTAIGALEKIHLRDGSSVVLGGRTKLSVAFSPHSRAVSLIQGQAWFKVAHNPHWPFIVTAGDGTITDIGTAFLVTRDSDRVVVTVTEGTVEVSPRRPIRTLSGSAQGFSLTPALSPIRISRGDELAVADNGDLSRVKHADIHAATAWTDGRLTFDDQPLRYVIETVDRYSLRHIAVSPSAGALRFSGIVHRDEIEDWLQGLAKIFPVSIEERGSADCIHMRNPTSARDLSCTTRP